RRNERRTRRERRLQMKLHLSSPLLRPAPCCRPFREDGRTLTRRRGCGCPLPEQVETPVVAAHDVAAVLRILVLADADQREAELAANRVRRRVVDRRIRIEEPVLPLRLRALDHL